MFTKKFMKRSFTVKFHAKVWSCNRPLSCLIFSKENYLNADSLKIPERKIYFDQRIMFDRKHQCSFYLTYKINIARSFPGIVKMSTFWQLL